MIPRYAESKRSPTEKYDPPSPSPIWYTPQSFSVSESLTVTEGNFHFACVLYLLSKVNLQAGSPSPPTSLEFPRQSLYVCGWIVRDEETCGASITSANIGQHLAGRHGLVGAAYDAIIRCKWKGCHAQLRSVSFLRHVREVHMLIKRRRHQALQHSSLLL